MKTLLFLLGEFIWIKSDDVVSEAIFIGKLKEILNMWKSFGKTNTHNWSLQHSLWDTAMSARKTSKAVEHFNYNFAQTKPNCNYVTQSRWLPWLTWTSSLRFSVMVLIFFVYDVLTLFVSDGIKILVYCYQVEHVNLQIQKHQSSCRLNASGGERA